MDRMQAPRPESAEASGTLKILLAFVAGLALAAGGFWVSTRQSAPPATAQIAEPASKLPPSDRPTAPIPSTPPSPSPAAETPALEPETPAITARSLPPPLKKVRPSVFGKSTRSETSQPPPLLAPQDTGSQHTGSQNTSIASAKDLPDLKSDAGAQTPPVASDSQASAADRQPSRRVEEPVFRPDEQAQAPSTRQPQTVTIDPGVSLVVRLGETLSTERNATGDTFRGTLESPIIRDGFIIAEKGSPVRGRIANSQKAGRVEGLSTLALTLTEINTTDGQTVRVRTSNWEKQGNKSVGEDAAKIGAGAAIGAIIGAIAGGGKGAAIGAASGGAAGTGVVLATRGKPTVLPVETRLTFRLDAPLTITERINH